MEIEKIFNDLESNQTQECEEAKKKLLELFTQNKEQWPVHYTMEYYLKTGSVRIMEVLVRVQSPHDTYILDRLAEWLKMQTNRVFALNLFSFVVRRHPTWLCKLEKHRLIKDILKLLLNEKEIVPLMSALLCIITLLPIIPNLVPNFLGELCEVFGHLASYVNNNRVPEEKLVHMQLGLQMLFQRLYGMYPCNFLNYLSEFAKRERNSLFQHTIKPLLETVRMHPMLVTATTDSEVNASRWKEMEPHDVVMECVQLSLPLMHQHCNAEHAHHLSWYSSDWRNTPSGGRTTPAISSGSGRGGAGSINYSCTLKELQKQEYGGTVPRFDFGAGTGSSGGGATPAIWSPYNEICSSGPIPLTPTPSYLLPPTSAAAAAVATTANLNNQLLGVTGSSPPEAAVEATPETTPMKDSKDLKPHIVGMVAQMPALTNPHAVRAIFASSQPSSPMRKDQHNQFSFPDVPPTETGATAPSRMVTTTYDRRLQQIIQDRTNSQSPFQTIDSQMAIQKRESLTVTPDVYSDTSSHVTNPTPILLMPLRCNTGCDNCNSGGRYPCKAGGVHLCIGPSMQVLAKDIRRRTRMATYNCNERMGITRWDACDDAADSFAVVKVRRTKSFSSFSPFSAQSDEDFTDFAVTATQHNERRLQKSSKMLAIATATKKIMPASVSVASQTVEILPNTYESSLLRILEESQELCNNYESSVKYPHEKLDQYILQSIRSAKDCSDAGCRDQEQYQLLWLHLQYERYRREIHAERNRRLMGRSRHKRGLEMERERLLEQLESYDTRNKELIQQIDRTIRKASEREQTFTAELTALKAKYQSELEQNKCLRQANENLQTSLSEEQGKHRSTNNELEVQLGKIFNMAAELEHAQAEASMGLQWKQELARLEAEFIVMGEVQIRCRDRLAEMENFRARDEELRVLQDNYNVEMKDLKHTLEEKSSQLDSAKYKIGELQAQLQNNEKVITEQKRLLKAAKDEYEERFKSLSKKYEVQKTIIMQMEEKIIMSLHKPHAAIALNACSPDTDKTDIASSMERNSPLSTSLASSESFSASLRSTELRNLQQLVETPIKEASSSINVVGAASANIIEGTRLPALDLASSASTATAVASAINIVSASASSVAHNFDVTTAAATSDHHTHPHIHLQQQQQQRHHQQKR